MYNEVTNHHEKPSPSINHECTVKLDVVVKISEQKINGLDELSLQIFQLIYSNMIMIKKLMFYFGRQQH